jgi:hypothetical protein
MSATRNRHVDRYLDELSEALGDLPRRQRDELVAEIEQHITETVSPEATDAEVLTALDRIGDPEQIAAAERERLGIAEPSPGWLEWLAIPLLLVGGIVVPGIGWIVGVIFLWLSRCWSVRDKLLGTLVVPGGLLGALVLPLYGTSVEVCSSSPQIVTSSGQARAGSVHCTGGMSTGAQIAWIAVEVLLIIAPIAVAIRLGRRLPPLRGSRSLTLPSGQSLALLLVGALIGGAGVWYYLSSRPPSHTARAEVLTGYVDDYVPSTGMTSFVAQSGDDPLGALHHRRMSFHIGGDVVSYDCRRSPCAQDSGRNCLRGGTQLQPVQLGLVSAETPEYGIYPVVYIRCLPG